MEAAPRACILHASLGRVEPCPFEACAFFDGGCAIEELELDLAGRPALARWLLDLRAALEAYAAQAPPVGRQQTPADWHEFHRRLGQDAE